MWRRLNPKALMMGALLMIAFLGFIGHGLIRDPDFWWHIRTGQWIIQHNLMLPGHDIYTFWGNPNVWTDHEWGSEVLMWLTYSTLGSAGIVLGFALVTMAGFILMLARADITKPAYLILGAGGLLGLVAGVPIWGPRPQMLEFFFAALELFWLERYLRGKSRGWSGIYWLPLVMIVWANLHSSWALAFLFLGAAITSLGWKWLAEHDLEAKSKLVHLGVVFLACVGALLLTPNGPAELLYPLQTQGSAAQQALIQEWFSPNFHLVELRPFEALLFVALISFMIKRPNLYSSLLVLGTLAMALESVRHIVLFMLAATPVMIDSYGRIWKDQTAKWEERAAAGAVWARRLLVPFKASPVRKPSAILVLVSWLVLAIAIGATTVKEMSGQVAYDHGDYPVVATDYVLAHPGTCLRIYNEYGWGGYMVYRLYPSEHRVYIFGEAALEGDQHLNEYEDVAGLASNWQQLLSQAQVDCVVFPKVSGLASTLKVDPQWKLVHEDNVADIFVRN